MRSKSHIEWTESTWNPVTGCTKISAGCKNCYAARMAARLKAMGTERYANGFAVTLHPDLIDAPRSWKAPRKVFVNSMSDLFHPKVPFDFIEKVFKTMSECPQHTFQVLTKRSERLLELAPNLTWSPNIWMGVSVEGPEGDQSRQRPAPSAGRRPLPLVRTTHRSLSDIPLEGIDWVIVGGESGPGARPMDIEWVRSIFRQCRKANSAFFFKQWGGVQKHRFGRELRGRTYDEMPVPQDPAARKLELLSA